jgi:hypothetical protein
MKRFLAIPVFLLVCSLLPLFADVTVKGSLTRQNDSAPGQTYEGVLELLNSAETPQEVKVYQTDYFFYADGRVLYGEPGKQERSNARWISFNPETFIIPPKESALVRYTVTVPADDSLSGSYWSLLMVEGIPEGSPESTIAPGKVGLGVRQVFRCGVQMITDIGAAAAGKIRFVTSRLVKEGTEQSLLLDIENTGLRWMRASVSAELYDPAGTFIGKFEADPLRLYPGTSGRFKIDLSGVQNNTYKAFILVDGGGSDIFGANLKLVIQ